MDQFHRNNTIYVFGIISRKLDSYKSNWPSIFQKDISIKVIDEIYEIFQNVVDEKSSDPLLIT